MTKPNEQVMFENLKEALSRLGIELANKDFIELFTELAYKLDTVQNELYNVRNELSAFRNEVCTEWNK